MKIIIDAMGGDNAPFEIVKGAIAAKEEDGADIILVGRQEEIKKAARENGLDLSGVPIVNADQVVEMEDDPVNFIKEKKDSSLVVGLNMLANGEGDAFVSAGSTGAILAGATLIVKRIRGIRRAALAPIIPTKSGGALIIDSGATAECTPEYLLQYAYMGHHYGQIQFSKIPRIGLLNIGTEPTKGTKLQTEAYELLKKASNDGNFDFIGNIEGRDVALGSADVIVCDGFSGNVLLKTFEGVGMFLMDEMKNIFFSSAKGKLAAGMVKNELREFKHKVDYKEIGGAPLLGISKPVIKAHGSSDARSFKNAIKQAKLYAESGMINRLTQSVGGKEI